MEEEEGVEEAVVTDKEEESVGQKDAGGVMNTVSCAEHFRPDQQSIGLLS